MTPEEAKQRAAELIADNQLDLVEVVAEWLTLQQKEPEKVKAVFSVDWSLLNATQESLREHMALAKAAQESEQQFRATVAAALAELRAAYVGENENYHLPYSIIAFLDATIAALGLADEAENDNDGKNGRPWL